MIAEDIVRADRRVIQIVKEAVEAEREACAKIADDWAKKLHEELMHGVTHTGYTYVPIDIAKEIRARGTKGGE